MIKNRFFTIFLTLTGLFALYKIVKAFLSGVMKPPDPMRLELEEIRRRQEATLRQIQEWEQFKVWLTYGGPLVDLEPGDALTLRKRLEKALEKIWRVGHEY